MNSEEQIDNLRLQRGEKRDEQLKMQRKKELRELRHVRERIPFNQNFRIERIDENGDVISETVMITSEGKRAEKGYNGPMLVSFNGITGYYKNTLFSSKSDEDVDKAVFDDYEYIICQLGKKLGIRMAETYKVYHGDVDMGIISRSVDEAGDIKYDTSDIFKLISENTINFPVDTSKLQSIIDEYRILRDTAGLKTFGGRQFSVIETEEDIEKAISGFSQLISTFQIPIEQKDRIVQDYYNMILLDIITGNLDRVPDNYGFVYRSDGTLEFSPLYDNSTLYLFDIPDNLAQINGYLIDREKLLDHLYEHHYDRIKPITSQILAHRDEYEQFMRTICERELHESDLDWILGNVMRQFDGICRRERQHNLVDSAERLESFTLSELKGQVVAIIDKEMSNAAGQNDLVGEERSNSL